VARAADRREPGPRGPTPTPLPLGAADLDAILRVINDAATAYRGAIPADRYHEPYMPRAELAAELAEMQFYGYWVGDRLVGVMGVSERQIATSVVLRRALPRAGPRRGDQS